MESAIVSPNEGSKGNASNPGNDAVSSISSSISTETAPVTTMADCNQNAGNDNEPEPLYYDGQEYYKVQLEHNKKEIIHLKEQLENSKKLANYYKAKVNNAEDVSDVQVTNQNVELDQAVQAAITDTIKSDQQFS
jgi:hypothetical protein